MNRNGIHTEVNGKKAEGTTNGLYIGSIGVE